MKRNARENRKEMKEESMLRRGAALLLEEFNGVACRKDWAVSCRPSDTGKIKFETQFVSDGPFERQICLFVPVNVSAFVVRMNDYTGELVVDMVENGKVSHNFYDVSDLTRDEIGNKFIELINQSRQTTGFTDAFICEI